MKKTIAALFFLLAAAAQAEPLAVTTKAGTFYLPLQVVNGTQLYSFKEGKGFPGAETVLWSTGKRDVSGNYVPRAQVTFGAAPVLGTAVNVPFTGFQFRLKEPFFDPQGNSVLFGAWLGLPSDSKTFTWGVKASIPLW